MAIVFAIVYGTSLWLSLANGWLLNVINPIITVPGLVGGFNPSEKYEFVSWDESSESMESHKIPWLQTFPNHQPVITSGLFIPDL